MQHPDNFQLPPKPKKVQPSAIDPALSVLRNHASRCEHALTCFRLEVAWSPGVNTIVRLRDIERKRDGILYAIAILEGKQVQFP